MRATAFPLALLLACSGGEAPEEVRTVEPDEVAPASAPDEASQRAAGPAEAREAPSPVADVTHAAPEGVPAVPEPKVGSWVRYRLDWREGGRSFTEYRVVGRDDDALIVEVTDRRSEGEQHARIVFVPNAGPGGHRLVSLSFKGPRGVEPIPERLLPQFAPMLQQWLGMLLPESLEGDTRETVRVPAGTFVGSAGVARELDYGGQTMRADVWLHPEVPITGMVRFAGQGQDGHRLEVLEYGLEGARSAFD
ncbi:MAG: hypothetical protein AAGH15_14020 [Myxococcota bacterium]